MSFTSFYTIVSNCNNMITFCMQLYQLNIVKNFDDKKIKLIK